MKKRKLNSTNPRYSKIKKDKKIDVVKKFIHEVKGVKVYTVNYLT